MEDKYWKDYNYCLDCFYHPRIDFIRSLSTGEKCAHCGSKNLTKSKKEFVKAVCKKAASINYKDRVKFLSQFDLSFKSKNDNLVIELLRLELLFARNGFDVEAKYIEDSALPPLIRVNFINPNKNASWQEINICRIFMTREGLVPHYIKEQCNAPLYNEIKNITIGEHAYFKKSKKLLDAEKFCETLKEEGYFEDMVNRFQVPTIYKSSCF